MKELFSTFREDEKEQRQLNIEAAKRNVGNQTEAEKKLLLEEGLDDFVKGGQTRAGGVELGIGLGAAALAKPALAGSALTATGNLIKKYPLKSIEVGLTGLGASDSVENPQDLVLETLGMKSDTMFTGPNPNTIKGVKKLGTIFSDIFPEQVEGGKRFFSNLFGQRQPVTPDGAPIENTVFKSVSEGGSGSYVPPTKIEIADMKQELMKNQLSDASGKLNIWNYFNNKKGRSNWGRLMAKKVQTLPHTKSGWTTIKNELQADFLSIYPEKFLKKIKYRNAKGLLVPLSKNSVEVEHIFTLQQSMPIFADVEWGGGLWNKIAKQVLSKQFALGDTRQNLVAVPEHIHRIKTQYFNKMAGIDGRKFFTDDVIKRMIADETFREAKINDWLKEVAKGKKIIDDGLTIWETLYKGKEIPIMPEKLVERLANVDLDTADIKKIIPQIFEDFKAEGFTTDAWNVNELKAAQLKIDERDVEATGKIIDKYIRSNPKKYNKPYPFGMRDQDLRDAAENAWVWMSKNKLNIEGEIQTSIFDAENKEKWIKFTMKSILNQSKRNK